MKLNSTNNPDCYQSISKEIYDESITLRFYQNYEDDILGNKKDLSKDQSISINFNLEALKFLKKEIDKSVEHIEDEIKYKLENEILNFDPPILNYESNDEDLYDDDLKTYFKDNPDARG